MCTFAWAKSKCSVTYCIISIRYFTWLSRANCFSWPWMVLHPEQKWINNEAEGILTLNFWSVLIVLVKFFELTHSSINVLGRFQSARTALELIEKAKKANEKLPDESRFDSNCITPGTEFMERLQQAFKHFVKLKLSADPAWRHCRVILSGHEVCTHHFNVGLSIRYRAFNSCLYWAMFINTVTVQVRLCLTPRCCNRRFCFVYKNAD